MAKRKQKSAKAAPASANKVAFQMRFDRDVYERITKLAEASGVSVNQLMHGLARWGVLHGVPGEPTRDDAGRVQVKPQAGCVFFGREARFDHEEEQWIDKGEIVLALDFTERHVIRET